MKTRNFFLLILLLYTTSCQQYVKFETTIHKEDATKDGIYINEYVVNMDNEQIMNLDNQKVQIKGRCTIVPGIDPNNQEFEQGRTGETKHILHPKIKRID